MGININSFSKDKNSVEVTENLPTAVQEENFDIMEYTNNKKNELRKSKEVEALTSLIEVENPDTILQFGRKASEGVARVSDSLLNTIKLNRNEENSKMLDFQGRVVTVVFENFTAELETAIKEFDPLVYEELPLTLEDLFEANLKTRRKGILR